MDAEQWIKEGKYALNWTRLSCHRFVANRVRLSLFILAYNLGNFLRRLCLPKAVKHWSLRSVQVKRIKMGVRLVRHARRLIFQLSEVSVPQRLFQGVALSSMRVHPTGGGPALKTKTDKKGGLRLQTHPLLDRLALQDLIMLLPPHLGCPLSLKTANMGNPGLEEVTEARPQRLLYIRATGSQKWASDGKAKTAGSIS